MQLVNKKGELVGVNYRGKMTQGVQEGSDYTIKGFTRRLTSPDGDLIHVDTPKGFRAYSAKTCGLEFVK